MKCGSLVAYCGKYFINPCSTTQTVKSKKMNLINLSIPFKDSNANGKERFGFLEK